MKRLLKLLIVLALPFAFVSSVAAQDDASGVIAFHYTVTPVAGKEKDFRDAMAAHMKWRAANGESWDWICYEVVSGAGGNKVHFRSMGHQWADMDAYQASDFTARADAHFEATVAPFVADAVMAIDRDDPEISAWRAEADAMPLLSVEVFRLKAGKAQEWRNAVKAIHAALQGANWPEIYAFSWSVSGGSGNEVALVLPRRNWADMAEPDPGVFEVVAGALGEERAQELFSAFGDAVESSQSFIVRRNDEMSLVS